jgi:hypothetical protein
MEVVVQIFQEAAALPSSASEIQQAAIGRERPEPVARTNHSRVDCQRSCGSYDANRNTAFMRI